MTTKVIIIRIIMQKIIIILHDEIIFWIILMIPIQIMVDPIIKINHTCINLNGISNSTIAKLVAVPFGRPPFATPRETTPVAKLLPVCFSKRVF